MFGRGGEKRLEFADGALGSREKFVAQGATLQIRGVLKRNDPFERSQQLSEFLIGAPLWKNCWGKSVLNGRNRADHSHHLLGAQTDDGAAKFIGEIPKRVEKALLFYGGAGFGEVDFVEGEDADLDLRQRVQGKCELFLRRGRGAKFLAQLEQDRAVQSRLVGEAGALQKKDGCGDGPPAVSRAWCDDRKYFMSRVLPLLV